MLVIVSSSNIGIVNNYPPVPKENIPSYFKEVSGVSTLYLKIGETTTDYYKRLSQKVFQGIIPYWRTKDEERTNYTRVSIWDNYLLWAYSYLPNHTHYKQYEFASPQKAFKRGIGLCSQVARIVYYILNEQNIPSKIISQNNHVVVETNDGIIDANYGIYIPFTSKQIQRKPKIIYQYYSKNLNALEKIYFNDWDTPDNHDQLYAYMKRMEGYAETLKWIIPILLLSIGIFTITRLRNQ